MFLSAVILDNLILFLTIGYHRVYGSRQGFQQDVG